MYSLLFVDDQKETLKRIKKMLDYEELGFSEVYFVDNAEDALKIYDNHIIDVVVSDINMPIMNGIDMLKEMKKKIIPKLSFYF